MKQVRAQRRKYHYIYKTSCLISGKYYIGMHSTDNLADGYVGSGKRLWYSINKHGKENHRVEILEHYFNREDLALREKELVNSELLLDEMCMNINLGGLGGWSHMNDDKEIKQKNQSNRSRHAGLAAGIIFRNNSTLAKYRVSQAMKSKIRNATPIFEGRCDWTGKKHSNETKLKMSKTHQENEHMKREKNHRFGKIWIYSEKEQKSQSIKKEELQIWIDFGWIKGRKMVF